MRLIYYHADTLLLLRNLKEATNADREADSVQEPPQETAEQGILELIDGPSPLKKRQLKAPRAMNPIHS